MSRSSMGHASGFRVLAELHDQRTGLAVSHTGGMAPPDSRGPQARTRKAMAGLGTALFFALAPGTVAGLVPWWLTGWQVQHPLPFWAVPPVRVFGVALIVVGTGVLVHAFVRFVVEGIGTPAPIAPTQHLVVGGLYRYVRNPMYLSVTAVIVGQALAQGQPGLLSYAALVAAAMLAFVHTYEEPALADRFGAEYEAYRRAVPAWWPRLRPWRPGDSDQHNRH